MSLYRPSPTRKLHLSLPTSQHIHVPLSTPPPHSPNPKLDQLDVINLYITVSLGIQRTVANLRKREQLFSANSHWLSIIIELRYRKPWCIKLWNATTSLIPFPPHLPPHITLEHHSLPQPALLSYTHTSPTSVSPRHTHSAQHPNPPYLSDPFNKTYPVLPIHTALRHSPNLAPI